MIIRSFVYFVISFLILLVVGVCWLWLSSQGTTPSINRDHFPNSITEVQYPQINGVEQFVLIRGQDSNKPLLLLLHGGPGDAQSAQFVAYNEALEKDFVVVNWDQRGAGASYVTSNKLTPEQILLDTHVLTQWLLRRFGRSRIFLLGHSWGSFIGLRAVHEQPCDYFAYIGIGQVADQRRSELLSYQSVLRQAQQAENPTAIRELQAIGEPKHGWYAGGLESFYLQRKWVREFGGAAYGLNNFQVLRLFAYPLLTFPSYTLKQKLQYLDAEAMSMAQLERPMLNYDLRGSIQRLEIPLFVLQGKHDLQTVTSVTHEYFVELSAPFKRYIEFENSAHLVPYEEPERFHEIMVTQVLPFAQAAPSDECVSPKQSEANG